MPELPEVQTIVNDLNRKVVGRKIVGVWFDWPKLIKSLNRAGKVQANAENFRKKIIGSRIVNVGRKGKNILIYLKSRRQSAFGQRQFANQLLLIHQKMTGHMLVGRWKVEGKKIIPLEPKDVVTDKYNSYIHLIFYLDNGKMLALSDLRKFAKVILGTTEQIENLSELKKLGPEPLAKDFTFKKFIGLIQKEKRKIKQVLMDQEIIAGIGNIYSDDILWKAKIHPSKVANELIQPELKKLFSAIKEILVKALKMRGTSTSDYRDTTGKKGAYTEHRLAYHREGEKCLRCGSEIKRIKLGGRSAHFCPICQHD